MRSHALLTVLKNLVTHHLHRVFLALCGFFIVLMSIAFYFTSQHHSLYALEEEATRTMLQSIKEAARNMDIQIQGRLTLLETIANRTIIKGKLAQDDASMGDRLNTLNDEHQRLHKLGFKRFGILDTQGIAHYTDGKKLYLGDKEHFINALKGENSVSTIFISRYENEPIYTFTTPIKDSINEKIIGVLFAASDAIKLSEMISSISFAHSGYAFIIDKEGQIIAHKDFAKVVQKHNLLSDPNPELSRIASQMHQERTGKGRFTENGKEWHIAYTPIQTTGWSMGLAVPHDEIHAQTNHLKNPLFIVFTAIVLMTLAIAYSIADIITRYQNKLELEKKEKDADLLMAKNKYETTLSALPDLLFELGLDGTYYECHSPHQNLLAAPSHQLIGQKVSDVLPPAAANICLTALTEANHLGFSRNKVIELPLEEGLAWFELSVAKKAMQEGDEQPHFIVLSRDISDRKRAEDRNYYLANFDYLTGLVNRTQLESHFSYMISHAKRQKNSFAVLFLDLDQFKEVNDTFGHHIGDKLLIETAHRLKFLKRDTDVIARLGGDEFVILLPNTASEGAKEVAQKVLLLITKPYIIGKTTLHVTVSIGISIYPQDGKNMEMLSQKADKAMYEVKKTGRNNFGFFQ